MLDYAKILKIQYSEDSTLLSLEVDKNLEDKVIRQQSEIVELRLGDGRHISPKQRKKAYAMIADIAYYTGDDTEHLKRVFKDMLRAKYELEDFSLSNCPMSVAREYITLIIEVCLEYDIPTRRPIIEYSDDIDAYLQLCLKHRRCAISGKPNADIHHVNGSVVGMGANRNRVNHADRRLIALSREWHTKVHTEGEREIFKQYKVYGVVPTPTVLKELGLYSKNSLKIGNLVQVKESEQAGHVVDILNENNVLVKIYGVTGEYYQEIENNRVKLMKNEVE